MDSPARRQSATAMYWREVMDAEVCADGLAEESGEGGGEEELGSHERGDAGGFGVVEGDGEENLAGEVEECGGDEGRGECGPGDGSGGPDEEELEEREEAHPEVSEDEELIIVRGGRRWT